MQTVFHVEGLQCAHCKDTLQSVLMALPGLQNVRITLPQGEVLVEHSENLSPRDFAAAVGEAGYTLIL